MNIIKFVGGIEKAKQLYLAWDNEATEQASLQLGVNGKLLNKQTLKFAIANYYLDLVGGKEIVKEVIESAKKLDAEYYDRINKHFMIIRDDKIFRWSCVANTYTLYTKAKKEYLVKINNLVSAFNVVNI